MRLTYNGQDTYKSPIGAVITVVCLTLVFAYALTKTPPLFDDNDTTMTSNEIFLSAENRFFKNGKKDWVKGAVIKPGVEFAVGLSKGNLSKRIGEFKVYQVKGNKKSVLKLVPCSKNETLKEMFGEHDPQRL